MAPCFVFFFAAAGITGGVGVAPEDALADGVPLLDGAGAGRGSGFPPQPLSTKPSNEPAASEAARRMRYSREVRSRVDTRKYLPRRRAGYTELIRLWRTVDRRPTQL